MRGFILAAGFGTRLRPITDHLPKALVPLAGKPLLGHTLDFLHRCGVNTVGVNAHYLPEHIVAYRSVASASFELFRETPHIRGTGGALHFARSFLGGDDSFIVINADIVVRFDIAEQLRRFESSNDGCRLLAWKNETGTGTVVYDPADFHYLGAANEGEGRIGFATADFIGIAMYRKEFLNLLTPDDFSILPVWHRAIERGMPVSIGLIDSGYWRDIGSPKSLAEAHFDIIDRRLGLNPPAQFRLDDKRRCCYPVTWGTAQADRLGGYCWIGDEAFDPGGTIERTVIFPGVTHSPPHPLRNMVLTPWGEMSFNE
ncbi:MAG: NTP transferase domain-containing protein [Chitinispirillaceae bacterium]|nr:NTP transferase domain-containing protein [Chitinispirillaceae bacterium]